MGPDMEQLLTDSGFQRYRGWMKFKRGPADVERARTDLEVRRIGPDGAAEFAAIAAPAFDSELFEPVRSDRSGSDVTRTAVAATVRAASRKTTQVHR